MESDNGPFYCSYCGYDTDHRGKYDRHVETIKHLVAKEGIECCGIKYYSKHKWVNHKKSPKHHENLKNGKATNTCPITLEDFKKRQETERPKITLNLEPKSPLSVN